MKKSIKRAQEIEQIREKMLKAGKDRYEIQDALMSFELPKNYKAKNERLGDNNE